MAPPNTCTPNLNQDPTTSMATNPFDIPLVFNKILDFTGPKSILQCRAVDRYWNLTVLNLLRKQGRKLSINSSNINEYLDLVYRTNQTSPSLKLSVFIGQDGDSKPATNNTISQLAEIIHVFGSDCVESIHCSSMYEKDLNWRTVFDLIRQIAPGMKAMLIKEDVFNETINQVVPSTPIMFPELRDFTYSAVLKNSRLLVQIVNSAPKLENLSILLDPYEQNNEPAFQQRNEMVCKALNGFQPACTSNLVKLEIFLDNISIYRSVANHKFQKLRHIKLQLNSNAMSEEAFILNQLLRENCPLLESLEFSYIPHDDHEFDFPNDLAIPELPPLPELPKLKQFAYGVEDSPFVTTPYIRLAPLRHNQKQHFPFPNLTSIEIKVGTFLFASEPLQNLFDDPVQDAVGVIWHNNHHLINNVTFPNVTDLNLWISKLDSFSIGGMGFPFMEARDFCNQTHMLFPNIKKLSVKNQRLPTAENINAVKYFLEHLFEEISGFEVLEMFGYYEDWVTAIVKESLPPHRPGRAKANLQSLKSLKIHPIEKRIQEIVATNGASIGYKGNRESDIVAKLNTYLNIRFLEGHLENLTYVEVEGSFLQRKDTPLELQPVEEVLHAIKEWCCGSAGRKIDIHLIE